MMNTGLMEADAPISLSTQLAHCVPSYCVMRCRKHTISRRQRSLVQETMLAVLEAQRDTLVYRPVDLCDRHF